MTDMERRKLRGHYLSPNGIEQNLRETKARGALAVDKAVGEAIADEFERLEGAFPALGLSAGQVRGPVERGDSYPYYPVEPVLTRVTLA
jgi:hypothetical protein